MRPPFVRAVPSACAAAVALTMVGCASWERDPPDPQALLAELESISLSLSLPGQPTPDAFAGEAGLELGIEEAASWAVQFHPDLRARRRALDVAQALVVEAGALPDLGLSWSAMDMLAVDWTGGSATTEQLLSGAGLMWRLPRPDEWPAREDLAEAGVETQRCRLLQAEWELAGAVRSAYVEHLAALLELSLGQSLVATIARSADWYERAREAGTATPLQAELAAIERSRLGQEQLQRQGASDQSRQRLCALLGLPPTARPPIDLDSGRGLLAANQATVVPEAVTTEQLVAESIARRPDLRVVLARYEEAEQQLRLEVARQLPQISIGTGIEVMVGLFRGFDNPAIDTARMRRALLGEELRAAIHRARAEIHEARRAERQTRTELLAIEKDLLPRVERSLELSDRGFRSGAASFSEVLETQRRVLDARSRHLRARAQIGLARVALAHALGLPLPAAPVSR